jgi:uncharacterized LabA/DUF88 family protein
MTVARADEAVLISGDRDFAPTVRSLHKRGLPTHVVFWRHAAAGALAEAASEVDWLEPHLD